MGLHSAAWSLVSGCQGRSQNAAPDADPNYPPMRSLVPVCDFATLQQVLAPVSCTCWLGCSCTLTFSSSTCQ